MKSFGYLYDVCVSENNRRASLKSVKSSKRFVREIRRRNLPDEAILDKSCSWIINYKNSEHVPKHIQEGTGNKERCILIPTIEELFVQHCVVNALMPAFLQGVYEHTYASIPGRGMHQAKRVIEKWIKKDSKNCKYVLKMDIKQFFDSIPHDILKSKLRKTIRDDEMLDLLFKIIDVTDVGLPIGFYTSQWLSNWYLKDFDHYIKEKLGAIHYVRYMDDMVIFGSNKKTLHRIRKEISVYLENVLGLELKGNWQVYRFSYGKDKGRDLDFMGFRFYRYKTTVRKRIMYKMTRKARKISKKKKPTSYDARQMISYYSWLIHTNSHKLYLKHVKPYVDFFTIRQIISRKDQNSDRVIYRKLASAYILS